MKVVKSKIYFTDFGGAEAEKEYHVSVNCKLGNILFGKPALDVMGLTDGSLIKFMTAPDNKLGWKVKGSVNIGEVVPEKWKMITISNANNSYVSSIKRYLEQMKGLTEQDRFRCEIQKYVETSDQLSRGDTVYFIELIGKNKKQNA